MSNLFRGQRLKQRWLECWDKIAIFNCRQNKSSLVLIEVGWWRACESLHKNDSRKIWIIISSLHLKYCWSCPDREVDDVNKSRKNKISLAEEIFQQSLAAKHYTAIKLFTKRRSLSHVLMGGKFIWKLTSLLRPTLERRIKKFFKPETSSFALDNLIC